MSRPPAGAAAIGRLGATRRGEVVDFDPDRGLGVLEEDGGLRWPFHCVELTDGSRRVEPGARVVFVLGPGHAGELEARQLVVV